MSFAAKEEKSTMAITDEMIRIAEVTQGRIEQHIAEHIESAEERYCDSIAAQYEHTTWEEKKRYHDEAVYYLGKREALYSIWFDLVGYPY